ncbi:MAG: AI-2E family transporter [Clostridia bacterium]|nr:AI-2E family transporter [Clostridia bacterium]
MFDSLKAQVVHEGKLTLKDWVKSQIILTAITLAGLLLGLNLIGIDHWIMASVAITIVDLLPVLGLSITMIPWAFYELVFAKDTKTGLWIFFLFIILMVLKQALEPFIRGASLGISPWEEIISSVAGFALLGGNGLGLLLGPVVYIVGKKIYRTNHPAMAGRATTGYFDRGFGQKAEPAPKQETVIDITDDVVDVPEE